ncbi:hypothetical protein ACGFZQ_46640 [Streptomyces sp. NPDC048254]|uniref:hypothetical protein n=1 Tax=Streptomyces sp. NPDC048254 TaxID=3365525 RepID=UPI0037114891
MITMQVRGETGDIVARGSSQLDWTRTLQHVNADRFPDRSVQELLGQDAAAEIEGLCQRVERGSPLYLWFLGD